MNNIEQLISLYHTASKHSNYQVLPVRLSKIIPDKHISVTTRFEPERLHFILNNVEIKNKNILDIGGNTGFFTFELLEHGAKNIHYYEGNIAHANFVMLASKVLKNEHKIKITNEYYSFEKAENEIYDIILLLNVLHHVGDDYGNSEIKIEHAKNQVLNQLNVLAYKTSTLILQLGFNWKGSIKHSLFQNGTKKEMIDYITEGTKDYWQIEKIGIAEKSTNTINYQTLNARNIQRDDILGEFLNRPIFILKSLK